MCARALVSLLNHGRKIVDCVLDYTRARTCVCLRATLKHLLCLPHLMCHEKKAQIQIIHTHHASKEDSAVTGSSLIKLPSLKKSPSPLLKME